MWVADMDFATPPFIIAALRARLEHPIFGYTQDPPGYYPSIVNWLHDVHQWRINPDWLCYIPGVVKGIGMALQVFTEKGDRVVIQPPVYHLFRMVIEANGRQAVNNLLKLVNGQYEMDFERLEQTFSRQPCRLFILCNPHNPGGTAWSRSTLATLAALCAKHGVTVIADEIHADLALFGHRYTPFATVSDEAAQHSITFGAPSKTFNMAGLVSSFAVTPNDTLRRRFYSWLKANELNEPTIFAAIATEAAYTHGHAWRLELLRYLEGNIDFAAQYLAAHIPAISAVKPQASFLLWLDCRALGLSHAALIDLFERKAGLALNEGAMFGPGGEGFMRMNIGTPRSVVAQALQQLANEFNL
jgi:cystathionine beta-lyase